MTALAHARRSALLLVAALIASAVALGVHDRLGASASEITFQSSSAPGAHSGHGAPLAQTDDGEVPAQELRIILERQLGQHAMLAVEAMRAGVAGHDHFDAAAGSLADNTDDLVESVTLVYGDEGGETFRSLWEDHIDFFVQYTVGVAEDDQEAQEEAIERLDQYRQDFGSFLEEATEGELPQNAVADLLQEHVDQLVTQVDAYAANDFETAAAQTREAYAHMFGTAQGLAGAIVATQDGFPGELETGPIDLRSTLGQLLGEHAQVAIQAMRSGVTGEDDFDAIAGALDANTQDLTGAIEGIFGAEAGEAFMQLWADHIDFFVQYTVGVAEDDAEAQDEALQRLEQYKEDFSSFLEGATEENLPADAAAEALQVHVDDLVDQIDQFAAGDFDAAFDSAYDAHNHMFDTAEALAGGITAVMGDVDADAAMPEGGVETGAGGTAGR